jgi:pimeloyl-ACP methyl ester carboxylesterase
MATYVLVHGGSHGGWCYQPVAWLLRSDGHEVYTPTLTGLGERRHLLSPAVDLEMHITDVANVLEFEDLREVVLVGHGYGGMVITGVADRLAERISHLVFLNAATPVNHQSLADLGAACSHRARDGVRVVDGIELVGFPGEDPLHFYEVRDPEKIAWMETKLTPQPWRCFEQRLNLVNEDELWKIPQTHIVCTSSWSFRDRALIERLAQGRVFELDTGHDLMITEPAKVADLLARAAEVRLFPFEGWANRLAKASC